jgi:hypothetical protein
MKRERTTDIVPNGHPLPHRYDRCKYKETNPNEHKIDARKCEQSTMTDHHDGQATAYRKQQEDILHRGASVFPSEVERKR